MTDARWPPELASEPHHDLLARASDYALATGLVVRPFPSNPSDPSSIKTTEAIHAPYALWPSPFSRDLFSSALDLQPLYNQLYAKVTADDAFLDEVVGKAVSKVDEFQGRLYEIWKTVKKEGLAQVHPFLASFFLYLARSHLPSLAAAPLPRPLPLRLPPPLPAFQPHRPLAEASRVQHHLVLLRLPLDPRHRSAPLPPRLGRLRDRR